MNRRAIVRTTALVSTFALAVTLAAPSAAQPYGSPQYPAYSDGPAETLAPQQRRKRSATQQKVTGCLVGGVLGGLLGAAASDGGNRNASIATGAALGCMAGFAFAATWSARDRAALEAQTEAVMDAPQPVAGVWTAPESRQQVSISSTPAQVETARVDFEHYDNIAAPQAGAQVIAKPYRTTDVLRLRSSPDASTEDNIVGRFEKGEIVEVLGASADGRWAMIGYDGVIVGYSSFDYLATLDERQTLKTVAVHKPRAERPPAPAQTASTRPSRSTRVAAAPKVKTARVMASTRCKSVVAVSGQQTDRKKGCANPSGDWKFA